MLKALVVSADSIIGGHICEKLGAAGTTRRTPSLGRIPFNLLSHEPLPFAHVTYFCSGINGFKACAEDPEMAHLVNVEGTVRAAKSQIERGGRVVLLSSCAAETHRLTVYGDLKLETENEFMKFDGAAAIFRFGPVMFPGRNTYPNQKYNPISIERLIEIVTGPFEPGLHKITNPDGR